MWFKSGHILGIFNNYHLNVPPSQGECRPQNTWAEKNIASLFSFSCENS